MTAVTEHWHSIFITEIRDGGALVFPTGAVPTMNDAKEQILAKLHSALEGVEDEESRAFLAKNYAKIKADLDAKAEPFALSVVSGILAVYDCRGGNTDECRSFSQYVTREFIETDLTRAATCDCPLHREQRESAPDDDNPRTGMYL